MKKLFRETTDRIKEWWISLSKRNTKYFGLGPSTEIDDSKNYSEMLDSAFNIGCRNIAITGPYGSGKSSVLKSYIESKNRLRKKQFISISLAAFKTELEQNNKQDNSSTSEQPESPSEERKNVTIKNLIEQKKFFDIEKSILQQLFYRTKRKKLYNSRFKKIKHTSIHFIMLGVMIVLMFLLLLYTIWSPTNAIKVFNSVVDNLLIITDVAWIAVTLLLICIVSTIALLGLFTKYVISRLRVSKLSVSSASITFDKNDSSIFNKYLDEIIYFFEVTNYKVVIIEDLDRFENISISIFTKLRELNRLINNSMQIKQEVTFIYAVKDGLFNQEDERTKFFDFIVPVIPVINYSNSSDMFTRLLSEVGMENEFDKSYVTETLRYFDDMRLLKNTLNEYIFYKNKISRHKNEQLDDDKSIKSNLTFSNEKLISLLFYKNLNPEDFEAAQKNCGKLFSVFENKTNAINAKARELSNRIQELNKQIEDIDKEHLNSISELVYIFKGILYKKIGSNSFIENITIDSNRVNFGNINENFDFSMLDNFNIINVAKNGNRSVRISNDDFDIEYGNKKTLEQRKELLIEEKETLIHYRQVEINKIEKQLLIINDLSAKDFIHEYKDSSLFINITDNTVDCKIIKYFIRNGYIDEYYINIISLFYDINLTRSDFDFILSVQDEISFQYNYNLSYCNEIVKRLDTKWFDTKAILNYDLLSYLLKNDSNSDKLHRILKYIGNKETFNFEFIDSYIKDRMFDVLIIGNGTTEIVDNIGVNIEVQTFIYKLCSLNPQIWLRILRNIKRDYTSILFYINLIANYAGEKDLLEIKRYVVKDEDGKVTDSFTKSISQCKDFLFIFSPEQKERAKFIIRELDIKFEELNIEKASIALETYKLNIYDSSKDLLNYVYDNNHYTINSKMITQILKEKSKLLTISYPNYTNIIESEYTPLIDYINDNIAEYIKTVFLSIPENEEDSVAIEKLLKINDVTEELKMEIIKGCKFDAYNLNNYNDNLWHTLISEKKLQFYWGNVFIYYTKFGVDSVLIKYLNENLIGGTSNIDVPDEDFDTYSEMFDKLVTTDAFIDDKIKYMIIPNKTYIQLDIKNISRGKIDILIEAGVIPLNEDNYEYIRINYRKHLIKLLASHEEQYNGEIETYGYTDNSDNDIANDILINHVFSHTTKLNIIKYFNISTEYTCENIDIGKIIVEVVCDANPIIQLYTDMRDSILSLNIGQDSKIKLLYSQLKYLDNDDIRESLKVMEGEFKKMITPWQTGKLPENDKNLEFIDKLDKLDVVSSYKTKNKIIYVHARRT